MERHILGRTGVSVSKLCLGTMMFGAWGNPDHDESIRIIHAALDAGVNFVDTADVYARGESEEIVGKALAGGRRDDIILATKFHGAMGDDAEPAGQLAPVDRPRGRGLAASPGHRLDRPLPGAPPAHRHRHRGDAREPSPTSCTRGRSATSGPRRSRPARSSRRSGWRATGVCERFVTEQPAYSILARAIESDVLPTCSRHGMGVLSYSPLTGGWLSGRWRKDSGQQSSSRAERLPDRFDLSTPANQRKLDAVEQLAQLADEAGITLIQLAIAFVLNHPAITAPIIGPRTMEQLESQLAAADVALDEAVLDRIDEIVAPGTTINPLDNSFDNPALWPAARRR